MRPIFFLSLFVSLFFMPLPAKAAQIHSGFCDDVKSTAEAMECVNEHSEVAQKDLNDVYQKLLMLQDANEDNQRELLNNAEQSWVAFKKDQCIWEATLADTPGLRRLHELSCQTRTIKKRQELLETFLDEKEKIAAPKEVGQNPRWLNVLSDENPDVIWEVKSTISSDIDCDTDVENIITGVKLIPQDNPKNFTVERILAVTENPVTGRPKTTLFSIPVDPEAAAPAVALCSLGASMTLIPHPDFAPLNGELLDNLDANAKKTGSTPLPSSKPHCTASVKVSASNCKDILLVWDGSEYNLRYVSEN